MGAQTTEKERAIEAVARHLAADWTRGTRSGDVCIVVGRKRIPVDVIVLKPRAARQHPRTNPHLRFDKVAVGLVERLRTALVGNMPNGTIVMVSVTAPIRLASKTADALEQTITTLLERRSPDRDSSAEMHGNRVRVRVARRERSQPARLVGFVHNPDSDPSRFFDMTEDLITLFSAAGAGRETSRRSDRWLIVDSPEPRSCIDAYRSIHAQLRLSTRFDNVLVVFADGRVETLTR